MSGTIRARLAASRWENPAVRVLRLRPEDGGCFPPAPAGAHIEIGLPDGDWRRYSLIDAPDAGGAWAVAVQRGPGPAAAWLTGTLADGAPLPIRGPHQGLALVHDGSPVLLVAGGIGITPFLGMLAPLAASGRDWRLVYAVRSRAAAAFLDRLAPHAGRVTLHADDEAGAPLALPPLLAGLAAGTRVYVCGPPPMMAALAAGRMLRRDLHFHGES